MRKAGLTSTNASDPRLLALIDAGMTPQAFGDLAAEAVDKRKANGWAWVLAVAKGRISDAGEIREAAADAAQQHPEDPLQWSRQDVQSWACRLGIEPWDEVQAYHGQMPPWPSFKQRVIDAFLNRNTH
jgi:hypothetical protein